jgi:hypothetical protein
MRLEGLGQLKNSNDIIGTRTRDLPACSIVPERNTLPRALLLKLYDPEHSKRSWTPTSELDAFFVSAVLAVGGSTGGSAEKFIMAR